MTSLSIEVPVMVEKRTRKPKQVYSPEGYVCEVFENDPLSFCGRVPPHGGSRAHSHAYDVEFQQPSGKNGSSSSQGRAGNAPVNIKKRGRPPGSLNKPKGLKLSFLGVKKRGNKTLDQSNQNNNKWDTYKKDAMKYLRVIAQANYIVDVYRQDKGHQDTGFARDEINRHLQKIYSSKKVLKSLVEKLSLENEDHIQFDQLQEEDMDGMIDINDVNCSVCNLDAENEENDIILCDRAGCYRAYHLLCLDPPIQSLAKAGFEEDDDWFCWKCETLDYILDRINDFLSTNYDESNLFPELDENCKDTSNLGASLDEEEDEEDEDYNPDEASVDSEEMETGSERDDSDTEGDYEGNDDKDSDGSDISTSEFDNLVAEGGEDAYLRDDEENTGYKIRKRSSGNEYTHRMKFTMIENCDEKNILPEGARRQRSAVDYTKLNQLLFGGTEDSDAEFEYVPSPNLNRKKMLNCKDPKGNNAGEVAVDNSVIKRKRGRPRKSESLQVAKSLDTISTLNESQNGFKHRLLSKFSIPSSSSSQCTSPNEIIHKVKVFMENMGVVNIHDYCNSEGIEYELFMTYIAKIFLGEYDQHMNEDQIIFFKDIALANVRRLEKLPLGTSTSTTTTTTSTEVSHLE